MRFVHTADWQLGMRRAFLDDDASARFGQARIDAIGALGKVVTDTGAAFVVVAGDVFESNHIDRRTVVRALEQLADVPVPVYLLPGNHDPLSPGSVYDAATFRDRCPPNVEVLDDARPRTPVEGVEVVGVPWCANEVLHDAVAEVLEQLEPPAGVAGAPIRVVVAHGVVDRLQIDRRDPGVIDTGVVERALAHRQLDFLALGDRHSTTSVGSSRRIWYAGAPEPTRFSEIDAGNVLVVDLTGAACEVTPVRVGRWRFVQRDAELAGDADLDELEAWLRSPRDTARTIVRLRLAGVVPLRTMARLEELLADMADAFACLDVRGLHAELVAVCDDEDLGDLDAGPITQRTAVELSERAAAGGPDAPTAAAGLALLYRLARRAA